MLARLAVALLGLAPLLQSQLVEKLNGPLAGNVGRFTWTPDGREVLYGAAQVSPSIEVVMRLRLSDRSEVVYDPYALAYPTTARTAGFTFLPDPGLVGVSYSLFDGSQFPPWSATLLHILERDTATPVTVSDAQSPRFLDDGRMLYRTSFVAFRGSGYVRGWIGTWDVDSTPFEISPPVQPDNYVSLVLPAQEAGVAVFGWRDSGYSANNAELLSVPLGGGAPTPMTPPPVGRQRAWIDVVHVRSSDELVIYQADEETWATELWAVPVDGSLPPRRLNPPLLPGRDLGYATVSPDETRLVFVADVEVSQEHHLWSTDIDGGTSVRLSGPMVPGGDVGYFFDSFWISPDGARVVYLADQRVDGVDELYTAPIDGHAPAVLLHPALPANQDALKTVHFTPDGRFVVFAVRIQRGVVLLAAPTDASHPARVLNWPFPRGGGVLPDSSGILSTVAIAPARKCVFFLGEQNVDGVVELFSVPIDASAPTTRWSAPLVAGGDVNAFALSPSLGRVLYRADQDVDEHFELYLSELPGDPPPGASGGAPMRMVTVAAPD